MSDGQAFEGFSVDAITFLRGLRDHNDRTWFNDHKAVYEQVIKQPAEAFCGAMQSALFELTGHPHRHKVFRIHRDVRFSKDKTPYNTHLHIAFFPEQPASSPPGWFFGLDPEALTVGTGLFAFDKTGDKTGLERFRERVVGPDGARLEACLQALKTTGIRLGEPDLKRVPGGYPKDHPRANLLRCKGLTAWIDYQDPFCATKPKMVDNCLADFRRLKPIFDWLVV